MTCMLMLIGTHQGLFAQDWFGLEVPAGLSDPHAPTILIGKQATPQPIRFGEGLTRQDDLRGEHIHSLLETIVGFSRESRRSGEKMWGRIAGRPTLDKTVEWAVDRMEQAGIDQITVDTIEGTRPLWLPQDWSVTLHGPGPAITLESAFPQRGSPGLQAMRAPLVFVGGASPLELAGKDIAGKVAVVHRKPDPGLYHARGGFADLQALHPAAIIVVVELPGNMYTTDGGGCSAESTVCFNIGGIDGQFLEEAMNAAQRQGAQPLEMSLSLEVVEVDDATALNAVAVIPGKAGSTENMIINAHADGYFEAASDNGDGLAVQVALAEHYARPQNQLQRNLVFVVSAGHHTINGPRAFVAQHQDITRNTVFVLNLEHVAQINMQKVTFTPDRYGREGYRDLVADAVEFPLAVGIDSVNGTPPLLAEVFGKAAQLSGKNIHSHFDDFAPGELGGYAPVRAPRAQLINASYMYHSSGDVLGTVTPEGLERAAHYFKYVIDAIDKAPSNEIMP